MIVAVHGAWCSSSLGIFRSIGPALAIAVAVTLLAALTLVPAIVTLLGRALFWPSKKYLVEPKAARFAAVGPSLAPAPRPVRAGLGRRARPCWPSSRSTFNPDLRPRRSEHLGRRGVDDRAARRSRRGSPRARLTPTTVLLHLRRTATRLSRTTLAAFAHGARRGSTAWRRSQRPADVRGRHRRVVSACCSTTTRPPTRRSRTSRDRSATPRTRPRRRAPRPRRRRRPGLRGLPGRDEPRLLGRLPGRRARDHADPGPVAAQSGRTGLPDGRRSASASARPWARPSLVFQHIQGDAGPDLHPADLHLPVRGRPRHGLQHPDDRATTRGGPRGLGPARTLPPRRSSTVARRSRRPA